MSRRVDQIELGARLGAGANDFGDRAAVLLRQSKQQVAPAPDLLEACRIEVDGRLVLGQLAGQRFDGEVGRVEHVLQTRQRRIDPLDRRQLFRDRSQSLEDCILVAVERRGESAGQRAQLVRVFQPSRLVLEAYVFAVDKLGVADLAHDVPEVVGAALRFGSTLGEVGDLADRRGELGVGLSDARGIGIRAGERVEDSPLRGGVEQRLRFVLSVDVHERASDFGEDARAHGRPVDPRPRAPRGDLALEHHDRIFGVDSVLVEQRANLRPLAGVERPLDRGAVGAAPNHVGAGALSEQEPERADDDRLPRPRLARENVESGSERQRERFDDREIPNSQLAQHPTPAPSVPRLARRALPIPTSA